VNRSDEREEASAGTAEEAEERSPVEPAVVEGRDPGWEELLALADRVGPNAGLATVDDAALQDLVCTGAARLAAEMCHWLDLIAELVIRRTWADEGCRTPAIWLSYAVGMSPSAARDHVRVALRLRELHRVREAFAAGSVSYSKVRAICRVAVPETEELLLEWSHLATGADMERRLPRLWGPAAPARPSHPALGGRGADGSRQPGAHLQLPSSLRPRPRRRRPTASPRGARVRLPGWAPRRQGAAVDRGGRRDDAVLPHAAGVLAA
jgi:hypothetical protein